MKKLLIVDDEKDLLETYYDYFCLKGYLTYIADSVEQALVQLEKNIDLIILDVSMPNQDGFSLCKQIRDTVSVPIIFLSARVDEASKLEGLMVGGDDYLTKPIGLKELEMRVIAHLRREERRKQSQKQLFFGQLKINYESQEVMYREEKLTFTKTEFLILELLTQHAQQVFSKEAIYNYLWDFDKVGDSNIIAEHIRRIRTKIRKATNQEMIETVWGVGYKWIG